MAEVATCALLNSSSKKYKLATFFVTSIPFLLQTRPLFERWARIQRSGVISLQIFAGEIEPLCFLVCLGKRFVWFDSHKNNRSGVRHTIQVTSEDFNGIEFRLLLIVKKYEIISEIAAR